MIYKIAIDSVTRSRQRIHKIRQNAKWDRGTNNKHQLHLWERSYNSEDSSDQGI